MDDGLRSERLALPLAEAAARLGISAEALCQRLDRGEAQGFERDGTSFVYLDDLTIGEEGARQLSAGELSAGDLSAGDLGARRSFGKSGVELPSDGTLPVVVEFQKLELTRLLRENERLNTRMDQLFDEIRHLREMQQREQVLRQQEQTLRRRNQETLDRLTSRPALPPPSNAPDIDKPRPELVLARTVAPKRPVATHLAKSPPRVTPARSPSPAPSSPARPKSAFLAGGADRREPHASMPRSMPGKPITNGRTAAAAPASTHTPAPAARAAEGDAIGPEEAAELATILNDIGHSLRDSEAFRRYPPIKPGSVPQRAGDRRPANVRPNRQTAPSRPPAPTHTKEVPDETQSANNLPPKKMSLNNLSPNNLAADEAALAAILDSMGPTAEDRRTAARNVRRLLSMPSSTSEP